jgi:hypothetical protein
MLERTGRVELDRGVYEQLLKGPLHCPRAGCKRVLPTIAAAKSHVASCNLK